jgi:hypothetical protein
MTQPFPSAVHEPAALYAFFFSFLWGETMTTLAMMSSAIKWFRESARPLIFLTIITGTVVTIDVFGQFEAAAKAGKQYRTARRARLKTH